jgi:uncharacterized membrane protein
MATGQCIGQLWVQNLVGGVFWEACLVVAVGTAITGEHHMQGVSRC